MKNRATSDRLRGFLNDLESLMALPFLRAGGEPAQVVSILLETLVGMLGLAFAFVRLDDPDGGLPIKTARVTEPLEPSISAREIGEALEMALGDVPLKWLPSGRLSIGDMKFSISSAAVGLQGEFGVLVAGSQKLDFPGRDRVLSFGSSGEFVGNSAGIAAELGIGTGNRVVLGRGHGLPKSRLHIVLRPLDIIRRKKEGRRRGPR